MTPKPFSSNGFFSHCGFCLGFDGNSSSMASGSCDRSQAIWQFGMFCDKKQFLDLADVALLVSDRCTHVWEGLLLCVCHFCFRAWCWLVSSDAPGTQPTACMTWELATSVPALGWGKVCFHRLILLFFWDGCGKKGCESHLWYGRRR